MFYIFVSIAVLILFAGFYFWKRFSLSRQFLDRASLNIVHRYHHLESGHSASGQSKNGALLFAVKRISLDTRHIVIKEVKLDHAVIHVSLDQLIMITFPAESNQAYEASIRFRIRGQSRPSDLMNQRHATVVGYITSESAGRIPFRIQIPVSQFIEQSEQVRG
jgi:hypothetical protein